MEKHIQTEITSTETRGLKPGAFGKKRLEELNTRESMAYLYQGVTLSDMEVLFRMDRRTIMAKLAGQVKPCATRPQEYGLAWLHGRDGRGRAEHLPLNHGAEFARAETIQPPDPVLDFWK